MSPTPKELYPQNSRKPVELLYQVIGEGRYSWLLLKSLGDKGRTGLLIDFSSSGELCVHLITEWWREDKRHREVGCGDDFKKAVKLNWQDGTYMVNWGGEIGNKIYERVYKTEGTVSFVLIDPSCPDKIDNLSFQELEEGLLRAAGRL